MTLTLSLLEWPKPAPLLYYFVNWNVLKGLSVALSTTPLSKTRRAILFATLNCFIQNLRSANLWVS